MELKTLNTGIKIPIIGSGTNTFGKKNQEYFGALTNDLSPMKNAIKNGYRHFDSALIYGNETIVGSGIKDSSSARENFFITSKLPGETPYVSSEESVKQSIRSSLVNLQVDYIDLYYLHYPWGEMKDVYSVWEILEDHVNNGIFKSIGVSNFDQTQLSYLSKHADISPAVIQLPSSIGNWNEKLIDFSLTNNILPVIWSPLASVSNDHKKVLEMIGNNYGKTWAQVLLNYHISRGVGVIPKSHSTERQKQNLQIFDFTLSNQEKQKIEQL